MIEHRHLRAFVAVAEARHFGRAAQALHLSQPALSRTVHALEETCGVALLARTTRQVELTPAGAAFLERARRVLADLDGAVDAARLADAGFTGTVSVAYMDFAILGALPELVARFARSVPDVHVELRYAWTERQRAELLDGALDVGVMIGPFRSPAVRSVRVAEHRYVAVLPGGHPLARRRRLRLADLRDQPFVLGVMREWGPLRETVTRLCAAAGFAPRVVREAHSRDGIFGFVAAGLGVTLYTDAATSSPRRGTVIRPLADVDERLEVIAAWRDGAGSAARDRFVDFLRAEALRA